MGRPGGPLHPLRLVVAERENEHGVHVEELECGHTIHRKQDAFGYTNARRRRCRHCAKPSSVYPTTEQRARIKALPDLTPENFSRTRSKDGAR